MKKISVIFGVVMLIINTLHFIGALYLTITTPDKNYIELIGIHGAALVLNIGFLKAVYNAFFRPPFKLKATITYVNPDLDKIMCMSQELYEASNQRAKPPDSESGRIEGGGFNEKI